MKCAYGWELSVSLSPTLLMTPLMVEHPHCVRSSDVCCACTRVRWGTRASHVDFRACQL